MAARRGAATRWRPLRARWSAALLGVTLLQGCATQGDLTVDQVGLSMLAQTLASGQVRLACEMSCSASWSAARKKAKGLHDNGLWLDLAAEVSQIGYGSDLTYFYLARAADGLGQPAAAQVYYRLSLASERKCDGMVFNSCDGINVAARAKAALK